MVDNNSFAFTTKRIGELKPPAKGRYRARDTRTPGLCVVVTAAGSRTYYLYRKVNGRPVERRIGTVEQIGLDAARKAARDLLGQQARGVDLQAEIRAKREEPTFGNLWAVWSEKHGRHLRAWKEWERIYNKYLSGWANRRLGTIKKTDVEGLHLGLGNDHGHVQANRALSLAKMIFSVGETGTSPAAKVKKFREQPRDRYLQVEELPRFFTALAEEPSPILQGFFLVCLATAARRGTVQKMKWSELDFKYPSGPYWRCPQTKKGEPKKVNLLPIAVEVLEKLRTLSDGSEYVFPAVRQGKKGTPYLTDPMPAWRRLCQRGKLEGLTIHDLRRSTASWAAISGVSMQTIAAFLGHSANSRMTEIYSQLSQQAERSALTTAVDTMMGFAGDVRFLPEIESRHTAADNGARTLTVEAVPAPNPAADHGVENHADNGM